MITAPLMKTGVEIDLPLSNIADSEDPLVVSINKIGEIFLSEKQIVTENLTPKLKEIKKANPKIKIF